MNIWISSDSHFGHQRNFLYEPRGFSSIQEHNEQVIKNWNELVAPGDIVYHLGDVMLGDNERGMECLRRLNGNIKLIRGNHDSDTRWKLYQTLPNVESLGWAHMLKVGKQHIYLSHFPTIVSNYDIDKPLKARVINCCGHSHTGNPFQDFDKGLIYHCELDAHANRPVLLDDIIKDIKRKLGE